MFANADCDSLLDLRDSSSDFDAAWQAAHEVTEKIRFILNEPIPTTTLRELAFKAVFDCTEHHDLAACVSDDFGLIGFAGYVSSHDSIDGFRDATIEWLWHEYSNGRLPVPPMPQSTEQ
jgi:hypothetical protein